MNTEQTSKNIFMYKNPIVFLTIDTALPASNPLRFRKNLFDSYKNDNN